MCWFYQLVAYPLNSSGILVTPWKSNITERFQTNFHLLLKLMCLSCFYFFINTRYTTHYHLFTSRFCKLWHALKAAGAVIVQSHCQRNNTLSYLTALYELAGFFGVFTCTCKYSTYLVVNLWSELGWAVWGGHNFDVFRFILNIFFKLSTHCTMHFYRILFPYKKWSDFYICSIFPLVNNVVPILLRVKKWLNVLFDSVFSLINRSYRGFKITHHWSRVWL